MSCCTANNVGPAMILCGSSLLGQTDTLKLYAMLLFKEETLTQNNESSSDSHSKEMAQLAARYKWLDFFSCNGHVDATAVIFLTRTEHTLKLAGHSTMEIKPLAEEDRKKYI